jgi:hypothetical protein
MSQNQLTERVWSDFIHFVKTWAVVLSDIEANREKCFVCLEDVQEMHATICCLKRCHYKCLETWSNYSQLCPLCRRSMI